MRLVRGAPGSGKTRLVFEEFKAALNAGRRDIRIVVPTATLVRHFQHELARDGEVFAPGSIVSLSRFVRERAPEKNAAPEILLRAIVHECAQSSRGMAESVLDAIGQCENAGLTPERLGARRLPPQARAFEKIWRAVTARVHACGYAMKPELMRAGAANPQPLTVWMDGFVNFSPLEKELLAGVAKNCDLTVTLTDFEAVEDLRRFALQLGAKDRLLAGRTRTAPVIVVEALSPERETGEIARRAIELNRGGVAWRQIAIALRDTDLYLPLLRTTFERFGIPARFYFSQPLATHPAAIFLGGIVSGAIAGWDWETTIEALRAHPQWGRSADFDRFDVKVREAMPGRGAEGLLSLCESARLKENLAHCLGIERWKDDARMPVEWTRRMERIAAELYRSGAVATPSDETALTVVRSHTAALAAWIDAIVTAADFWPDRDHAISLEEFWRVAGPAVESAVWQASGDRADTVHVMSVYEARQWNVRALFVCGMTARDFPERPVSNPLLGGTGVERSERDQEKEERALFEALRTRASETLVLSASSHDAAGKRIERSRFLDEFGTPVRAAACRPARRVESAPAGVAGRIHTPALLTAMKGLHRSISLTALENLAQCRFRFFSAKTLGLEGPPDRPGDRLSPLLTGLILHLTMERWLADREQNFVELFETTFDEVCRKERVPAGYKLEVERMVFRAIARKIGANERWQPDASEVEKALEIEFPEGIAITCRVDRIDRFGDDCVIVDYKSGKNSNVEKLVESRTRLQGPLYALAVREKMKLNPLAMVYWAVREDELYGWGSIPGAGGLDLREMPANWAAEARERTVSRLADFLGGAVHAHPEEQDPVPLVRLRGRVPCGTAAGSIGHDRRRRSCNLAPRV